MILINILEAGAQICGKLGGVVQIFGYVYVCLKIATPITLIVVGMISATKAIASKNEEEIKTAWRDLIKKTVAAVSVFAVLTIVELAMNIAGTTEYRPCMACFTEPFNCTTCSGTNYGICPGGKICRLVPGASSNYQCFTR